MLDLFIQIPGTTYLFIYGAGALLLIVTGWFWVSEDSLRYAMPSFTKFDPVAVAYLSGLPQVIRAVVFRLWSRNLIRFEESEGSSPTLVATAGPEKGNDPIEKRILLFLEQSHNPLVLFTNLDLRRDLEKELEPVQQQLIRSHLRLTPERKSHLVKTTWIIILVLIGAALLKLFLGASRNKPVGFLILEIIVAIILALALYKPWKKNTRLGSRYLKSMQQHFEWVKPQVKSGTVPPGMDPALVIAVFGPQLLKSHPAFEAFTDTFRRASDSHTTGCGGCGDSMSGSSADGGDSSGCGGCGGD